MEASLHGTLLSAPSTYRICIGLFTGHDLNVLNLEDCTGVDKLLRDFSEWLTSDPMARLPLKNVVLRGKGPRIKLEQLDIGLRLKLDLSDYR